MSKQRNKARTFSAQDKRDHRSVVGRVGSVSIDDISVAVRVVAERFRYGRLDLQVRPLAGKGSRWVEFHNVQLSKRKG
ncbi:MAG: hypothetical protein FJ095_21030 [Deltaproteobacteria bacterium]|nr:hypothetical protein [Deltaproteobacteria bacterium]